MLLILNWTKFQWESPGLIWNFLKVNDIFYFFFNIVIRNLIIFNIYIFFLLFTKLFIGYFLCTNLVTIFNVGVKFIYIGIYIEKINKYF